MSLDWNVSKIADYESRCYIGEGEERRLSGLTETLIWASLSTGIGTLKESNYREAFARLAMIEKLNGAFRRTPQGQPVYLTLAEVRAHVGLYTNASFKDESRASWLKRIGENQLRDSLYDADRRERQAADFEKGVEQQAAERAAQ